MKKRVGVRNDVKLFFNFIRSLTIGSNEGKHKMRRINYSSKRNRIKVKKSKFVKFNLENDAIHDAHKVICSRNLKKFRRYWAFSVILALSAIFALEVFELKLVKLRRFFRRYRASPCKLFIFRKIRENFEIKNN